MRAVFLGFESDILDALRACCDVVGVYVAVPRSPLRALRDWPLRHYAVRGPVRRFVDRYPGRFHRWRRRLMRYHIADAAHERGVPLLLAPSVNDRRFLQQITRLKPDIGVVANFGEILRQPVLDIPVHGFINFHPSPLPRYRGPTPLPHMMLHGETRGAVTWHQVSTRIDGGNILAQRDFSIPDADTVSDLTRRAVQIAADMLPELVRSIEQGRCHPLIQDESRASYYPKLSLEQKQRLRALEEQKRPRSAEVA